MKKFDTKNIRVRTLENYDLANFIDLELPLRLCNACERVTNDQAPKILALDISMASIALYYTKYPITLI